MKNAKMLIGTSGWAYDHWDGIFYPKDLAHKDKLNYFAKHFNTVEINYSFYRLPRASNYKKWYTQTPEDFIFAVKANRFITHIKRLENVKTAWRTFIENALYLRQKLGPILLQFSPSFKATEENIKRLEKFLKLITITLNSGSHTLKFAFEFRHPSWFIKETYKLLRKHRASLVFADSSEYPKEEIITADFVYVRMHGSGASLSPKYSDEGLKNLAKKIRIWLKYKLDVYVYFNNDAFGYAVENAQKLTKYL